MRDSIYLAGRPDHPVSLFNHARRSPLTLPFTSPCTLHHTTTFAFHPVVVLLKTTSFNPFDTKIIGEQPALSYQLKLLRTIMFKSF